MLQADTEQMYQTWIKALQEGIGKAIQGNSGSINRSNSSKENNSKRLPTDTKRPKPRYFLLEGLFPIQL